MASTAKLRDQARAAENRGQWREAATLYRELLDESTGDEADIALWNRVGDLHGRANETDRAVEAYEHAVGAYTEAGLFNNAIALCRKILRIVPGRATVYHKLGQISAAAGFLTDARQNFLEYAERMKRAGKPDAAFQALLEFADLSQDVEVRRLLADQLLAHGNRDQAVEQLRILLGAAIVRGDDEGAQALREQIRVVDPNADTSPLLRDQASAVDDFRAALHDGSADGFQSGAGLAGGGDEADGGGIAPLDGFESTALDDVAPAAGLEPTRVDDDSRSAVDTGGLEIEHTALDLSPGDDDEPLALVGLDDDGADAGDDLPLMDMAGEDDDDGGLPLMDMGDDEDDGGLPLMDMGGDDGGLPLMSFDEEPAPRARSPRPPPAPAPAAPQAYAPDRLEQLRAHVAAVPEDGYSRDELVRELRGRGLGHEVEGVLEAAHRALAARSMYYEAVAPITALIGLRPDDALLLQKRVEYAFRSGRPEPQVEAYLDLARYMARNGQESKAGAVFKRVLELDPHNAEARALAAQYGPPAPPAPRAPAPPAAAPAPPPPATPAPAAGGEYVDLGALIMDDEEGEPTTRFIVEEKEPSGDEDKDFAEMLAHFRQKVAENIEPEDSASHYDLGVAFMEMGLVDEAIAEFQVALRGGANPLATLELLGQCFVDKGQFAVGNRVLERALRLPGVGEGDLIGVLYLLGRIAESTGEAVALDYYERVVSQDIRFRDTAQRVAQLRQGRGAA